MKRSSGRLGKAAAKVSNWTVEEISGAFEGWVEALEGFGAAERERLFSPLDNLLAVPLASAWR